MALDLSHRIHRDADHDQDGGTAQRKAEIVFVEHELGQQADKSQIGGADHSDAGERVVDELGALLARTDAGEHAAILLQILGSLFRIEDDRGVEEREEDDQRRIDDQIHRLAAAEIGDDNFQPARQVLRVEAGDRGGQEQDGGREDRRDHARDIELQRKMRGFPTINLVAHLALGIGDEQAALGAFKEDDERHQAGSSSEEEQRQDRADGAGARLLQRLGNDLRESRHDAGEDDQRNAVADAAAGDLLADPHQQHGAAGQRDDGANAEEPARLHHDGRAAAKMLQADGDAISLHDGERDGEITGVLVENLAARLAFLLQGFEFGENGRHQLDDDRGRDVRHDAEGEDRHAVHGAAGQGVENVEQAAALLRDLGRQRRRIDARHRDIGADARHDQRAKREEDAAAQFLGAADRAEVEIGCQLFGCRCHSGCSQKHPDDKHRCRQ